MHRVKHIDRDVQFSMIEYGAEHHAVYILYIAAMRLRHIIRVDNLRIQNSTNLVCQIDRRVDDLRLLNRIPTRDVDVNL